MTTDTDSAELNYKKIQFTPNIDIPIGYEIIVEASALPEITICPTETVGKEPVAMKASTEAISKGTVVDLDRTVCYTADGSVGEDGTSIDYVDAEYTAYIRKTKTGTTENPKYKFATLTKETTTTGST